MLDENIKLLTNFTACALALAPDWMTVELCKIFGGRNDFLNAREVASIIMILGVLPHLLHKKPSEKLMSSSSRNAYHDWRY